MSFHDILAKPVQIMKEILDLEPELESVSLASQFVAIKHQLGEIQERLKESHRISHEKDLEIAKLQRTMAAKAQPRLLAPAFMRQEERPVQTPPVREPEPAAPVEARQATANRRYAPEQAELDEEIKLPAVPSYRAAAQQARSVRPRAAARTTPSPAKAEKARPTRTRVAAKKTSATAPTVAKPERTARATKPATTARVKPTRARVVAKKPRTATEGKATPKKSTRTSKRATGEKAKPARTRATAKTKAKTTTKAKRTSRAGKR